MMGAHEVQENYRELLEEYEQLREKYLRLREAALVVVDELEEDFDSDDGQPNKAMHLARELKDGLFGPGNYR